MVPLPPIVERLQASLPPGTVLSERDLHGRTTSFWDPAPLRARALVRPVNATELGFVLQACHEEGQPVVTTGGLTGAVSGAVADQDKIVISLERMNRIESIDAVDATCLVQAGATLQAVQERVAECGLMFPLDLGARGSCTIGGNIATNAGGMNVLRYGMMRNLVLGLEAVLADGTVVSSLNSMLKNNAGYDLKQLFIGTEGTLGVVTRAVLKLYPKPRSRSTCLVAMDEFHQVTRLLARLRADLVGNLVAFEVMWANYFERQLEHAGQPSPLARRYAYYILIETEGHRPDDDERVLQAVLQDAFEAAEIADAVLPTSEGKRRALWNLRENLDAVLQSDPVYLYDVSLPLRHVPAYVADVEAQLAKRWPNSRCFTMGHLADGNVHFFVQPGCPGTNQAESDEAVYGPLGRFHGSISAEHGIGFDKKAWLLRNRSPVELQLMRTLKRALDPKGILNPGCVIDV